MENHAVPAAKFPSFIECLPVSTVSFGFRYGAKCVCILHICYYVDVHTKFWISFVITLWGNWLPSTLQRSDVSASSILCKTAEWLPEAYMGYESSLSTPLQSLGSSLSTLLQRLLLLSKQWILSLLYILFFSIPSSLCYSVSFISSGNLFSLFLAVKLGNGFLRSKTFLLFLLLYCVISKYKHICIHVYVPILLYDLVKLGLLHFLGLILVSYTELWVPFKGRKIAWIRKVAITKFHFVKKMFWT